jgi:hypothetical protein
MSGSQSTARCQKQEGQREVDNNNISSGLGPAINEETALLPGPSPSEHDQENDHDEQEGWNEPSINAYRFISVTFTLFNLGLNDACVGVSLPTKPGNMNPA